MQKLTIKTKTADFKQGKYVDETLTAVVASTKSQNNLLDDLRKSGKVVTETAVKDFFFDKEKVAAVISKMCIDLLPNESEAIQKATYAHIMESLNKHCIFYNPIIRNK